VVHQKRQVDQLRGTTVAGALQHLARARQSVSEDFNDVRLRSAGSLRDARALVQEGLTEVKHLANQELATARQLLPATFSTVMERAGQTVRLARQETDDAQDDVRAGARRLVTEAKVASEALVREVTGQGPEKTLGRGFAFVRTTDGKTVTSASGIKAGDSMNIQFRDGEVPARAT
jgi:exodeoxyribonuclease VII large subunit